MGNSRRGEKSGYSVGSTVGSVLLPGLDLSLIHIFSCAEVLSYKGGNGDSKGVDNGPVNHVNFAVSGPCCHYIGTQGVDAGLDDNVGSRIHDGLKSCRQADLDDSQKHIRMDPDFSPV